MDTAEKILNALDPREIGRKLRLAREKQKITQDESAKEIGVARTTLIAIEKGERRIRPHELIQLVIKYGRDLNEFLVETQQHLFTQPQFRGPEIYERESDAQIELWIENLKELALDCFNYEETFQSPMVRKYPLEYEVSIGRLSAKEIGESIASDERQRLGLGDKPISSLRNLLEQEIGLRIYYLPIEPSKYSAIYLYSEKVGGCIAINSNHPEERARMSLAHDYGHFLTSRYKPVVYDYTYSYRSDGEMIADQFAIHFLMPSTGITRKYQDIRKNRDKFSPYDLVEMANYFGVSFEAMCYRLEGLGFIRAGTREKLSYQGFKVREAQEYLGLTPLSENRQRLPLRHQLLAVQALEQGIISESYFANLFEEDIIKAREIALALRNQDISLEEE